MEKKFLKLGIAASLVTMMTIGLSLALPNILVTQSSPNLKVEPAQTSPSPKLIPRAPPPAYNQPFGTKVSLEEAAQKAGEQGYKLMSPSYLPAKYTLNGVWAEYAAGHANEASEILLVYAPEGTPPDINFGKARDVGYLVLEISKAPPNWEQDVRQAYRSPCQVGQGPGAPVECRKAVVGREISIGGKYAVYDPGFQDDPRPIGHLIWADGNTMLYLHGDTSKFSFEDLLKTAESIR